MSWKIIGADRESGREVELVVNVSSKEAAFAEASRKGILVARIVDAASIGLVGESSNEAPPAKPPTIAGPQPGPTSSGLKVALLLSVLALLLSTGTLGFVLYGPNRLPGKGMSHYDFSSPEKALRSQWQMEAAGDIRAMIEYQAMATADGAKRFKDALPTVEVDRIVEHEGKSAVFFKYRLGGLDKYEVSWFERLSSGSWRKTFVLTMGWEDREGDQKQIAALIRNWESRAEPK